MDRTLELELIDELIALKAKGSFFLDEAVTRNPVDNYLSQARFEEEQAKIFRSVPRIAAHGSELANAGDFIRKDIAGLPLLITRDKSGGVNAFLNVCRHRGTRLVDQEKGCKHRFSCPYHAWTYANTGQLIAAPHFDQGFEGVDKESLSLKRVHAEERYGFVWVLLSEEDGDISAFFEDIDSELSALQMEDMVVVAEHSSVRKANWKLLIEGGIEAYHFKVAHRTTIGPHFEDNLSSYRMYGPHMRSVLPRTSLANLDQDTRESWNIREHANISYTLFPATNLLVQQDHIAWLNSEPLGPGETEITIKQLAHMSDAQMTEHWERNKDITLTTLNEDFELGESAQASIASGANKFMLFGRFEGALDAFNKVIEAHLDGPQPRAVAAE